MCGIFGFTQWNNNTIPLFPVLANEMEERGTTSWGVSNGQTFLKSLGGITSTLDNKFRDWDITHGLIFHTRAPSSGTGRAVENAHPFSFSRDITSIDDTDRTIKVVTGIHNGYISNHAALKKQYEDRKDFDVDSKHLFKHICDDLPVSELYGSGAISWFETHVRIALEQPDTILSSRLFIARFDTEALHVARLDTGEIIFASTKAAIAKSATLSNIKVKDWLTIQPRTKYEILHNPEGESQLIQLEPMEFGKGSVSYQGGFVNGHYHAPGDSQAGFFDKGRTQPNFPNNTSHHHGVYLRNSGGGLIEKENYTQCPGCKKEFDPEVEAVCNECLGWWLM